MTVPTSTDVSVLMPVHADVDREHFAAALRSVRSQQLDVAQLVVVLDGPLPSTHHDALAEYPYATLVRLPENVGSGRARAAGLAACTAGWVACFDSDDISLPHRLVTQLRRLQESGADVCSAAMTEFVGDPTQVVGVRTTPIHHRSFERLMRLRNPVNQPAVVFRRSLALEAGGYDHLPFHEDYDLWARMLCAGANFVGCADPLVMFRADGMRERRTRPEAVAAEREQQRRLRSYGLVGPVRARVNLALRTAYLKLPHRLHETAYHALFRSAQR